MTAHDVHEHRVLVTSSVPGADRRAPARRTAPRCRTKLTEINRSRRRSPPTRARSTVQCGIPTHLRVRKNSFRPKHSKERRHERPARTADHHRRPNIEEEHENPQSRPDAHGSEYPDNREHPESPDQRDELLTLNEVVELLRIPAATLRYWRHLGTGPVSFRGGRYIRYYRGDLDAEAAALRLKREPRSVV